MLLRLISYIVWAVGTWHLTDYVFTRNQMAGVYAPDADSIFIPIMTNQGLIAALGVCMFPIYILGSKWVIRKLGEIHVLVRILILLFCVSAYAFVGLITLTQSLSWLDPVHVELAISYGFICLVLLATFVWDALRVHRSVQQHRIAAI
jgi:hypothetical protein